MVTIQKCCCHPPGQYYIQCLCFGLRQGPTCLRLSTCFFGFYYFFDSFLFSTQDWEVLIKYALLFVLIQQNKVTFFSYSVRNYNAILGNSSKRESVMKNFRRNIGRVCYCPDLKMSWLEHFPRFNKRGVWNKNALGGKFSKN